MRRASGKDDPALAETSWPLPPFDDHSGDLGVEWRLRYGDPTEVRYEAAGIVAAYQALIADGTTVDAMRKLSALRRVYRRSR